jgi:hypothetical protein
VISPTPRALQAARSRKLKRRLENGAPEYPANIEVMAPLQRLKAANTRCTLQRGRNLCTVSAAASWNAFAPVTPSSAVGQRLRSPSFSPSAREKLPIVAIPIALKAFSGIVLSFQVEKLFELRVTRQYLLGLREFVISQVITAAAGYCQINQPTKGLRRRVDACLGVEREQIEDNARIRFFGPSQKALIIFFDQSNCTVNDDCTIGPQQVCGLRQKFGKIRARNINLGYDETRFLSADLLADLLGIIGK